MTWFIVGFGGMTSFLLFMFVFEQVFLTNKRMEKRMKHFLELSAAKPLGRKKLSQLIQIRLYQQAIKEKWPSRQKNEKLQHALDKAGVPLKTEEYIILRWLFVIFLALLCYVIFHHFLFIGVGIFIGIAGPKWWLEKKQKERLMKFNEGLPDMITTMIGSLRAGFSFAQSLKAVVDEAEKPIKEEVEQVLKEMQYGISVEDALLQLKERMPSEDLELMIQSVVIQKQVGGNLATVLETIVQTIRDRNKIQRQVVTLTAQGRLSGIVIGLLPVALGIVIYLMQPDYMGDFFSHPVGMMMIGAGLISGTIGFIMIRKLTKIEV